MATLVLTAVGTAIGGPLGGAVGAFIGRQADLAIAGGGSREGPRLRELAVTTSSYGRPIPRHFGRMRTAGTVIWSTDLVETTTKDGGGKGRPSTTTYSYAASFAVALSSTPIARVGRIWADGNLLRGAGGDLKVAGEMRLYRGYGDDPIDPLIAADKQSRAPAFRDCAYIVFEDLQLGEFGNRIPALTFEVFAPEDSSVSLRDLVPDRVDDGSDVHLEDTRGFADEGGALFGSLAAIDRVIPLNCVATETGVAIAPRTPIPAQVPVLPERLAQDRDASGQMQHARRGDNGEHEPLALRYYDEERDYQPGVQRALGLRPGGREAVVDLPATLNADGARRLASANAQRARWQRDRMVWRAGELDPSKGPGDVVRVPETIGVWRIVSREWYDRGVEYALERLAPETGGVALGDAGAANKPADAPLQPTILHAFEAPPEDADAPAQARIFAAASSGGAGWRGAALYAQRGGTLVELGTTGRRRAVVGTLATPLGASAGTLLERSYSAELILVASDLLLASTDVTGLALGSNRLMVGSEVLQFLHAEALGNGNWRISGLLRGRAGTEPEAWQGHEPGTPVVLLDDRLTELDPSLVVPHSAATIAALGLGDDEPVSAPLEHVGLSRRPSSPVGARTRVLADGSWEVSWVRRARGHWQWIDGAEVPLVEEREAYTLGYGPTIAPAQTWALQECSYSLRPNERANLVAQHGPGNLWVRQVGTYSSSEALHIAALS